MASAARLRPCLSSLRNWSLWAQPPVGRIPAPQLAGSPPASSFLRNYSAAAGSEEVKVKVPLTLFGVSGNYASALFIAASKANALEKVEAEILDVVEASKQGELFSQFIKDPSIRPDAKVKAIQETFSEAKFSDITINFLSVLAENGRLKHIEKVAESFIDLTMAHRGEVKAVVTSVIPLPADEERRLKETLATIIGHGKSVKLKQKIDPNILGGIVVEFGDKLFDMSIRTRAKQMERWLRDPVNFDNFQ